MLVIFSTSDTFYEVLSRLEAQHNIFGVIITDISPEANMSAIPMSKAMVSQLSMHMTQPDTSDKTKDSIFGNSQTSSPYYMSYAPKYNGKLMNSIWGMYNKYSPPSFQKNLEVQGMAGPAGSKAASFLG